MRDARFPRVVIGKYCSIDDNVNIGAGTLIGNCVIIKEGVTIGKNCMIEDFTILGYGMLTKIRKGYNRLSVTTLGDDVHIRTGSVIYRGCILKDHSHIAHNVTMREFTELGKYSSLGSGVVIEGYTKIGHHTTIHAQCHITARTNIGNYVFFGPNATTANDRKIRYYRPSIKLPDQGPTIDDGVVVGMGAAVLPYVHVEMGGFVAAGAVVTKKVRKFMMVMGVPAKEWRHVNSEEVVDVDYIRNEYIRFIGKLYEMDEEY